MILADLTTPQWIGVIISTLVFIIHVFVKEM